MRVRSSRSALVYTRLVSPGVVRILRSLALRTNPYWPFRHVNRLPYAAALRAFAGAFRARTELSSIYVRHGLAGGGWVPGLSDIDLTLILRTGLPADLEYGFLVDFWRQYSRLKTVFPMLGEVEILDEDEFPCWLSSSSYSLVPRRWRLLHGEPSADLAADASPRWRSRALSFALWIHMGVLPAFVSMPDSFLRRQDILRCVRKMLRLLEPILAEAGPPLPPLDRISDPVEAHATVMQALETAVQHVVSRDRQGGISEPEWLPPATERGCDFRSMPIPGLESTYSVLLRDDDKAWFLIEDGLDVKALSRLLRASQHGYQGLQVTPILLPRSLFTYLVRRENPFYYSRLLRRRTVAFGTDPLVQIDPPGRAAFGDSALDRIPNVLTFTRSEFLFVEDMRSSWTNIEVSLNRAVAARMLLHSGWISPQPEDNARRARLVLPESFQAYEEVKTHVEAGRADAARRASFLLFRSFARDICRLMPGAGCGAEHAGLASPRIGHS